MLTNSAFPKITGVFSVANSLLLLASLAYSVGGIFMKTSQGLTRLGPSAAVFALFVIGAGLQSVAMRKSELGTAYVFVLGLEAILAFSFGLCLFGEAFTTSKLTGVALIIVGISLLHR